MKKRLETLVSWACLSSEFNHKAGAVDLGLKLMLHYGVPSDLKPLDQLLISGASLVKGLFHFGKQFDIDIHDTSKPGRRGCSFEAISGIRPYA